MKKEEFLYLRKALGRTQKEIAELLAVSLKAIHSYEQGWRRIPIHAERQLLFLFSRKGDNFQKIKSCWTIKECPPDQRGNCPAWEFRMGKLCWFISGTLCGGTVEKNWTEKIKTCRKCEAFIPLFPPQAKEAQAQISV